MACGLGVVWLAFFDSGVLLLWFSRRATLSKRRFMWNPLGLERSPFSGIESLPDGMPVWSHPLPALEPWVKVLSRGFAGDVASDPLSGLCTALLLVGLGLGVSVVRMGIISTSLLSVGPIPKGETVAHAALLCALFGVCLGVLVNWLLPLVVRPSGVTGQTQQSAVDRRTWISAGLGMCVTAILYVKPISRHLERIVLRPRFSRRVRSIVYPSGFWETGGIVYSVPLEGRSKALFLKRGAAPKRVLDLRLVQISAVHGSALIPFVRARVKLFLEQQSYTEAFKLVQDAVVHVSTNQPAGTMPNLQLFDLLGAIARRAGKPEFLEMAGTLLADARISQGKIGNQPKLVAEVLASSGKNAHSRHAGRRARSTTDKKMYRLLRFQLARLPHALRLKTECLAAAHGLNVPNEDGSWCRAGRSRRMIVRDHGPRPPFSRGTIRLAAGRHLLTKDPAPSAEDVRSNRTVANCQSNT